MKTKKVLQSTDKLTRRETEILTWSARGKTRAEISIMLSLSEETVKDYLAKILRKLNAVNKTHAVSIACILGLIEPYEKDDLIGRTTENYPQTGDADDEN